MTCRGVACAGKLGDPYGTVVFFDLLNVRLRTTGIFTQMRMMARLLYVGDVSHAGAADAEADLHTCHCASICAAQYDLGIC